MNLSKVRKNPNVFMEESIMTMKRIFCASLAVVCVAASFASCGAKKEKKEKKDDFLGKWECEKFIMDGEEVNDFFGVEPYAMFQIELSDGNKGTLNSLFASEDGKPVDIEWKKDKDGKIQLINEEIFEDEEVFLVKEGDKMVMDMSEEGDEKENKAYLIKVDSFKEMPEDLFGDYSDDDDEADVDFSVDEEEDDK